RTYAGEYLSTRRRYEGLEGFAMRLQGSISVSVSDYLLAGGANGPAQRFVPTGRPDEFRNVSPRGILDTIRFERDGDRATRIALIPIAFERVTWLYQRSTLLTAAVLVLLTCVGLVLGALSRLAHKPAASSGQRLAGRVQLASALLWLAAFGAMA